MVDEAALLGTWRMVSWQREIVATGERADALGPDPMGHINCGVDGRFYALVAPPTGRAPPGSRPRTRRRRGCSAACSYGIRLISAGWLAWATSGNRCAA